MSANEFGAILGTDIPKGEPGGECARTACHISPAVGYNRSTGRWYCRDCSMLINRENRAEAELYGGDLVLIASKKDSE